MTRWQKVGRFLKAFPGALLASFATCGSVLLWALTTTPGLGQDGHVFERMASEPIGQAILAAFGVIVVATAAMLSWESVEFATKLEGVKPRDKKPPRFSRRSLLGLIRPRRQLLRKQKGGA